MNKDDKELRSFAAELSMYYYEQAQKLENHIKTLRKRKSNRPDPNELSSIEKRIEVLRAEVKDLRENGLKLRRLSEPKPLTPSLSAREREMI